VSALDFPAFVVVEIDDVGDDFGIGCWHLLFLLQELNVCMEKQFIKKK
jgi:hypothetical protein